MDSTNILVLFGIAIAVIAGVAIVRRTLAQKRTKALRGVAQAIGFAFEGEAWNQQPESHQMHAAVFGRGRNRRFDNAMSAFSAGFKTSLFDYSFTVGGGKNSHTFSQTVAAYSQQLWLPLFEIRPEGFLDRIGDAFVHKDIDFESHPDFSRRYLLRGPDESEIRRLFCPDLLTFLEELSRENKWHIEGADSTLFLYRSDVTIRADELPSFLEETSAIARKFFSSPAGLSKPVV
jgi:hypothetical protein